MSSDEFLETVPPSATFSAIPSTTTRTILHLLDLLLNGVFGRWVSEDLVDDRLFGSLVFPVEFFESILDCSGLSFTRADILKEAVIDGGPCPLIKPTEFSYQTAGLVLLILSRRWLFNTWSERC